MRIVLGLLGLLVFLVISAGLARVLSANNAERDAIHSLVRAEARGDVRAMTRLLTGCAGDPACGRDLAARAARARRPGDVKLLSLDPGSRFVLGGETATTRVAWQAGRALPVVQCVRIRRTGNVVSGLGVEVTSLGPPIDREAACSR